MRRTPEDFMRAALRLAERGRESVSPNPLVGAMLVKNGRVLGQGWHRYFGGPHAEVEAIRNARGRASGADLYVTLEPCGHHGKTPPCAQAVLDAGIRRVFFAARDPNPLTRGMGPRFLRRHGIPVQGGLLAAEARRQNAAYFHWRETGRPWVLLKWAMSADGKIATATGESRWISSAPSRARAQGLRRRVDAVLVGTGTARADNPLLLPHPPRGRAPLRIILDRRGRLPLSLQLFTPQSGPRLYVTAVQSSKRRLRRVEALGMEILVLKERRGKLPLSKLLRHLGARGISQLLVEGGETLLGDFLDQRLAQEAAVFIAPKLLGGIAAPSPVGGSGCRKLGEALQLARLSYRQVGPDLFLTGILR